MKNLSIYFLLLLCISSITCLGQTSFLEPNLTEGKYQVGFKVFNEYDYSRTMEYSKARPIQICVWYPAAIEKTTNPMPFKTYIDLMASQVNFDFYGETLQHPLVKGILLNNPLIKRDQVDLALAAKTKCTRDTKPKSGSFPVLIYAPGSYGSGFENSTMFEYLASQGFIVVSFPKGADYDQNQQPIHTGIWKFEPHTRDMEYVIGFMHKFPNANIDKLGLFGFSLGASTAINVASRNNKVKAIVSLDGLFDEGHLKWMPFLDLKKINVPFFDIASSNDNKHKIVYDNIASANSYRLVFNKFGHGFFWSSWILLSNHQATDWSAVRGTQTEINLGYGLLSEQVYIFFDGYLNGNKASVENIKLFSNRKNIPTDFLSLEIK